MASHRENKAQGEMPGYERTPVDANDSRHRTTWVPNVPDPVKSAYGFQGLKIDSAPAPTPVPAPPPAPTPAQEPTTESEHVNMGNVHGETHIHVHTRADGTKVRRIHEKTFAGDTIKVKDDGTDVDGGDDHTVLIQDIVSKGREENYSQVTAVGKDIRKYVWAITGGKGHAFYWSNKTEKLYLEETLNFDLDNMALEGHDGKTTFVCKLEPGDTAFLLVKPVIADTNCSISWKSEAKMKFRK